MFERRMNKMRKIKDFIYGIIGLLFIIGIISAIIYGWDYLSSSGGVLK